MEAGEGDEEPRHREDEAAVAALEVGVETVEHLEDKVNVTEGADRRSINQSINQSI